MFLVNFMKGIDVKLDLILVGAGGAFGSLTRYHLGKIISKRAGNAAYAATFLINITGALLLGLLNGLRLSRSAGLLLTDGFLGAYTTFSTFMYEGVSLANGGKRLNAVLYIILSLVFGAASYASGFALGHALG